MPVNRDENKGGVDLLRPVQSAVLLFSHSDAKLKAQPLDRVEVFTTVSFCLLDRLLIHQAALYL